jgi:M6 family metalloprotease-like protein
MHRMNPFFSSLVKKCLIYKSSILLLLLFISLIFNLEIYSQTSSGSEIKMPLLKAMPLRGYVGTMKSFKQSKVQMLKKSATAFETKTVLHKQIPVIAVKYPDVATNPWAVSEMQKELFDGPWPTGTLSKYFKDMSYGQFLVSGKVKGWYQISQNSTFYEADASLNNENMKYFLKEAFDLADNDIDFRQYDNDGPDDIPNSGDDDGYVDVIFLINAANNIAQHFFMYSLWFNGSPYETKDIGINGTPIKIDEYTMQNAIEGDAMMGIGVFCHELGHSLGLPDLYDIDLSSQGICNWGLMGYYYSNSRPTGMTAWSKVHLGWIVPQVIKEDSQIELKNSYDYPEAVILWKNGNPGKEYFLLENRQKIGFDATVPGSGLLVWHIDEEKFRFGNENYGFDNSGNSDENHRGVDLLKADGLNNDFGSSGDPFPGTSQNVSFNKNTNPSSKDYNKEDTGIAVDNISMANLKVNFNVSISKSFINTIITSPQAEAHYNSKNIIEITGSAYADGFKYYKLFYGEGEQPQSWIPIGSSSTPIQQGLLGELTNVNITTENSFKIKLAVYNSSDSSVTYQKIFLSPEYSLGWPQIVEGRITSPSVSVADINADGELEVIVGNSNVNSFQNKLYVWKNNGELLTGWPKTLDGQNIYAPAVGDVDGDGEFEIFVNTRSLTYGLRADGQTIAGWPKGSGAYSSPVLTDVDGDLLPEIIVADYSNQKVFVYKSSGSDLIGWPQSTDSNPYFSPVTGDINGDGKIEIISLTTTGKIYAWNKEGSLLKGFPIQFNEPTYDFNDSPILLADVNGDKKLEIICRRGKNIYVYDGTGILLQGWPRSIETGEQVFIAAGDLNNDSLDEIIVSAKKLYVWKGDGTYLDNWPITISNSGGNTSPILGDVNGDNETDIVFVNDYQIYAYDNQAKLISGWPKKIPQFVKQGYWSFYEYYSPCLVDLDNDNNVEVVLGAENEVIIWDLPFSFGSENMKWPKWQNNIWNTGSSNNQITMYPKPFANFKATHNTGEMPDTVHFSDNSKGLVTERQWDFGDKTYSSEKNPIHVYHSLGKYSVSLKVTGPGGSNTNTVKNCIEVAALPPTADFTADKSSSYDSLTVRFWDKSKGSVTSWKWNFGNGVLSTEKNPVCTFTSVDTFTVTLTVGGPGGSNTKIMKDYIKISEPAADFAADTTSGIGYVNVNFTDKSLGHIQQWKWEFGDGNVSSQRNPSHIYTYVDTFTVSLTIVSSGGTKKITKENFIKIQRPVDVVQINSIPTEFRLHQNYPNPFNPTTTIQFDLPRTSHVSLKVFNMVGQEITTLSSSEYSAGCYKLNWDASKLSSGIYFYQLITNDYSAIKKMILLK